MASGVFSVGRLLAMTGSSGIFWAGEGNKNKKPRHEPRKKRQNPLTNGEEYDKMVIHTVGVCRHGILTQHGYITTEYGGCQDASL